jgi:hypothetical protein
VLIETPFPSYQVCRELVDYKLLSKDESDWLHRHNESVKAKLLPLIRHDSLATRWLKSQ